LNLTSLILAKKHKLAILLWTVMAQDWEKTSTAGRVAGRLQKRVKSGSVICLHDSGCGKGAAPNAPEGMLSALSEFLPKISKKGFVFVLPQTAGEQNEIAVNEE
jgi:peptidoglycan/xylan/chitin deacetylase (PgdA/CDA1 family)